MHPKNKADNTKFKIKSGNSAPNNEQFHTIIFYGQIKNGFPKFCIPLTDRQPYTWSFVEKYCPVVAANAIFGGILIRIQFGKIILHFTVQPVRKSIFLFPCLCLVLLFCFCYQKKGFVYLNTFSDFDHGQRLNRKTNTNCTRLSSALNGIIALISHMSFQQFW